MAHPHKDAIAKKDAPALIGIIEESKNTYIRKNLSMHLHDSEIKLLRNVKKHTKPHHAKIRVNQFEKAEKTDLFNLHLELYLKKYQKLESKGLIKIDLEPENGRPYDCSLTGRGQEVLTEICYLEHDWADEVGISKEDNELLKRLALDSFEITYNHKKKQGFIF